ncbi:MAG: preprotein translocase subunit SecG [Chitinophagaceae bacterium]
MTTLYIILIVLASVVLGLIVLVQNPKGGGLAGNIAGFSNQFMGVKQTTDVLEKGTWIFVAVIAVLSMLSVIFVSNSTEGGVDRTKDATGATVPASPQPQVPANSVPLNPVTTPPTTPNK